MERRGRLDALSVVPTGYADVDVFTSGPQL